MRAERGVDSITWQREMKTTQMFAMLSLMLLLLWYPLFLLYTIEAFSKPSRASQATVNILTIMSHSTSALNPIVYGAMNSSFRACYKEVLCARCFINSAAGRREAIPVQSAEQRNGSIRNLEDGTTNVL